MAADKSPYEVARAALEEAAKGEDANAAAAKRALAALNAVGGDDDKKEEGAEEPAAVSEEDDEPAAAAAEMDEPDGDEPPKKESKAAAAYRVAIAAQKTAEATQAELKKRDERDERARLLASRPDLSAEMIKILQKAPMELVREHIAGLPKLAAATVANPRASGAAGGGGAAPTRGEGAGDPNASRLSPNEKLELDRRMGLAGEETGVESTTYKLRLGVSKPKASAGPTSAT